MIDRHSIGRGIAAWSAGMLLSATQAANAATSYNIEALSFNAADINSTGAIVGWQSASLDTFLYRNGQTQTIQLFGGGAAISDNGLILSKSGYVYDTVGGQTSAGSSGVNGSHSGASFENNGINNSGTIVGSNINNFDGSTVALQVKNGQTLPVGTLGTGSTATAINNQGDVAGTFQPTPGFMQASQVYRYTHGVLTSLGTLGNGWDASVAGINAAGQIAGSSALTDDRSIRDSHAFISTGNTLVDLGTLSGGEFSYARGINNQGQVVGYSGKGITVSTPDGGSMFTIEDRAFIYEGAGLVDLNTLLTPAARQDWVLELAQGISDNGVIFGSGTYKGVRTSFVLTAVPETDAVAMLAGGLAVLALMRRKRTHR